MSMTQTTGTDSKLRMVGMTDEQTECDKCGRLELRGTVILADEDGNEVGRYGTTCAGRMLGVKVTRDSARNVEAARRDTVYWEIRRARAAIAKRDHLTACMIVTDLERWTPLIRADETDAVKNIRTAAREIRAELRAAGQL